MLGKEKKNTLGGKGNCRSIKTKGKTPPEGQCYTAQRKLKLQKVI
jgi:hypothetical protein